MKPALVLAHAPRKRPPRTAWVSVQPELHARFKAACRDQDVSMSDQAELLIRSWLRGAGRRRPVEPQQGDVLRLAREGGDG